MQSGLLLGAGDSLWAWFDLVHHNAGGRGVGTLPVTVIEALNASVHSSWALGADTRASHFDLHWQGQVQASIAD